ncbi:hypothetical protein HYX06_04020 [Candidatus Woesearchaeota archaeon]|nr:hypothetical protein [Candidatus Woesearchaeota archaeon]
MYLLKLKLMNMKNKIALAHKGYFDKGSEKSYKENSKEVCALSTVKDYIQTIELDLRKSKDGVLYCYHGTFLQYYFLLKIPQKFLDIKSKYGVDSLDEILEVITEDKLVLLDIKDKSITRADIINSFEGRKFKKIILGNTSFSTSFLDRFDNMPEKFVKIMNGNIFCNFYNMKKLREKNYRYYEVVFPFQINKKIIENASKNGLKFSCAPLFFLSTKSYWKKINKYDIKHISSDFIYDGK